MPPPQAPETEGAAPPPSQPSATQPAPAAEAAPPEKFSYAWSEPTLRSGIGISAVIGGGVTGFVSGDMRDVTSDIGGLWDLRLTFGSHLPLAFEVSYVGTATSLDLPGANDSTLIGTAVEGVVRFNLMPHYAWTPYVFGGAGWQRYDVTNSDNLSLAVNGIDDHDNLVDFPLGLGIAFRDHNFVFDVRGVYRLTTSEDLVLKNGPSPTSRNFASMDAWEASAALGYEF